MGRMGDTREGPPQAVSRTKRPGRMRSTGSTSKSNTASVSACSAPTGRERRRPWRSSRGSISQPPAKWRSSGCRWTTDELAIRERIGVTLQETRLPDKETVHEIVTVFRSFYKTRREARGRDRPGRAGKQGERVHRAALRGPAAATGGRDSPGRRPRGFVPRRAHDRTGPAIPPPALGRDPRPRATAGAPSCSRRITWTRPSGSATGSPSSIRARSSPWARPAELIARLGGDHIVEFALKRPTEPPIASGFVRRARFRPRRAGRR